MSQFDVAIGIKKETLDQGASQLYADQQVRSRIFKGSTEIKGGTASWDIQQAPTFTLEAPPQNRWNQSIDSSGGNPKPEDRPVANAFQLVFPQFAAQYVKGKSTVSGTTEVVVFATLDEQQDNSKLTIKPVAVWLDESKMTGWDKFVLNQIILTQVFVKASELLSGLSIPILHFSKQGIQLDFTPPLITVADQLLLMAASLKSKGSVDITGVSWPDKPLFFLLSRDVIQSAAQQKVATMPPYSDSGKYGVLSYEFSASLRGVDVSLDAGNAPHASAKLNYDFSGALKPFGAGGPCAISAGGKSL
ncbi:hypothetical protein GK047_12490 [Paenibacillus sp. SYP-B3998]|uniref:Uncharacterized protein n=1 Tax=Paenibacillus sp. SYP-B3998 TaxID=2678564 RepID=A0A6G3ZZ19_9BACL|nr:hypothetical protein [Paenibacillus sp. SYP-B3998]NEW06829.1 hypothetical protein [Paenibacillus sp. SYP-B3998]